MLLKKELIEGRVLDFGCGRGFDADELGFEKYDKHYFPKKPKGKFDTVLCNYVLNVLPYAWQRQRVVEEAFSYLKCGGALFITVRRDKEALKGWTGKGTWQGHVRLFPDEWVDVFWDEVKKARTITCNQGFETMGIWRRNPRRRRA
jgi:SAM-dependent methyltransferase